jgi:RimJ/RimL family protein N-acetyltransferase
MARVIERATVSDAPAIAALMARICAERIYSAIDQPFTVGEQRAYLASLSEREGIFVLRDEDGSIIGLQTLEAWARTIHSMRHVAQLGTFIPAEYRRRGVGRRLFEATCEFARVAGYNKLIIQVRASNLAALSFYANLGFQSAGRLTRQVIIDGVEDDELLFELFL